MIEAEEIGIVVGIETSATILDHEHVECSMEFIESRTLPHADFHYLFGYMDGVPWQGAFRRIILLHSHSVRNGMGRGYHPSPKLFASLERDFASCAVTATRMPLLYSHELRNGPHWPVVSSVQFAACLTSVYKTRFRLLWFWTWAQFFDRLPTRLSFTL